MKGKKKDQNFSVYISTNQQKILSFMTWFSDEEFFEREIATRIGISFASANLVLKDLFAQGYIQRRRKGLMYFYRIKKTDPCFRSFRAFNTIILLRPLILKLIPLTTRIILFGHIARGSDTPHNDLELFVLSEDKVKALRVIRNFSFGKGYEHLNILPSLYAPDELLELDTSQRDFMRLVNQGIILWEKPPETKPKPVITMF